MKNIGEAAMLLLASWIRRPVVFYVLLIVCIFIIFSHRIPPKLNRNKK